MNFQAMSELGRPASGLDCQIQACVNFLKGDYSTLGQAHLQAILTEIKRTNGKKGISIGDNEASADTRRIIKMTTEIFFKLQVPFFAGLKVAHAKDIHQVGWLLSASPVFQELLKDLAKGDPTSEEAVKKYFELTPAYKHEGLKAMLNICLPVNKYYEPQVTQQGMLVPGTPSNILSIVFTEELSKVPVKFHTGFTKWLALQEVREFETKYQLSQREWFTKYVVRLYKMIEYDEEHAYHKECEAKDKRDNAELEYKVEPPYAHQQRVREQAARKNKLRKELEERRVAVPRDQAGQPLRPLRWDRVPPPGRRVTKAAQGVTSQGTCTRASGHEDTRVEATQGAEREKRVGCAQGSQEVSKGARRSRGQGLSDKGCFAARRKSGRARQVIMQVLL
jgi:hypothetical protein